MTCYLLYINLKAAKEEAMTDKSADWESQRAFPLIGKTVFFHWGSRKWDEPLWEWEGEVVSVCGDFFRMKIRWMEHRSLAKLAEWLGVTRWFDVRNITGLRIIE